jgi:membrane-associated phospholipid phosphatase
MGMALTVWLDFAHSNAKIWSKIVALGIAITYGVTIAYSRLFLGVHSLDQVLYGLLLGSWCAFTM